MTYDAITIKGARQNNLRHLDLKIPLGSLVVITGVSGSGKSSLAFDTIYAEGQRRYVETFSPYARQFLDRMDKPKVTHMEGIPPAIAVDQTNPVRTSRSTVGTMTEINDHLKLLYARAARLWCPGCGRSVRRDTPQSAFEDLLHRFRADTVGLVTFSVPVPGNFPEDEVLAHLARQGYTHIHGRAPGLLEIVQGRVRISRGRRDRVVDALEAAFHHGRGQAAVHVDGGGDQPPEVLRYSADLHCPHCDLRFREPQPGLFSFNSPVGACGTCKGFGRVMGIDWGLVVPDDSLSLADGAVRPWQTDSYRECQDDLMRFARKRGIPVDLPWRELSQEQRNWVLEGEGDRDDGVWYGTRRFFRWLETKSYRMHIRVLLSKYRAYDTCPQCRGSRLQDEALNWRIGSLPETERALDGRRRFRPPALKIPEDGLASLPGLTIHDVMQLPIEGCRDFFRDLRPDSSGGEAVQRLLEEIRVRLCYLVDVGLGYLSLDRQSRTLSGGEVQRINLTTALGTSLVNTLFVLDEPSIGLHPRDVGRMLEILVRLRAAGNSLLVVEHDPQVMRAADRIIDMGPGPGEDGGRITFNGTPDALLRSRRSLTSAYLTGRREVSPDHDPLPPGPDMPWLEILGAREHNLRDLDARIPLNRLVCITGVSGSGKSTLIHDVCYRALRKIKGQPTEPPGALRELRGHEHIEDVVMVDQSPIGRTARSNPASYVGALGPIRKLFSARPLARARGYTAGTFSFNSGDGRCPACSGAGFEHVEMQFLSDVYLRCQACNGTRFRAGVLEVTLPLADGPASIADVLDMTVARARTLFQDHPDVVRVLSPLQDVGLDYLHLGQPVPTLSGGEAQRLKLAAHLAGTRRGRGTPGGTLFLFDEPTTGLHFADIERLLQAFARLLARGHSLVVIEHNLDVIRAADWIIDLGPEGGEAGGNIVAAGMPRDIARAAGSHTGAALREPPDRMTGSGDGVRPVAGNRSRELAIRIHNAREHNLKNVDVTVPRDRLTVITGVSGSGKSTVAFDILFNEGQRRYLESLNAYARQFVQPATRPDVDAIYGIPPTVAIEQRTSRGGYRSTVATMTEIHHFLRLLFVRLGVQHCPQCDIPIEPRPPAAIVDELVQALRGLRITLLAPLVVARKGYYSDLARWAARKGFPYLHVDGELLPTDDWPRLDRYRDHNIDLPVGEIQVANGTAGELRQLLDETLDYGKGTVRVLLSPGAATGAPPARIRDPLRRVVLDRGIVSFSTRRACPGCGRSFEALDPRLFSYNSSYGWCEACSGTGLSVSKPEDEDVMVAGSGPRPTERDTESCRACGGRRLRPEALAVRFHDHSIASLSALSVAQAEDWFRALALRGREAEVARDILAEVKERLRFLRQTGIGYLTLDRAAPSLSGGEAQRIRLAAQLGSNLRGVCYILDEPTIGLHPRDNRKLLDTLGRLRRKGNTVVVVEHDEDTIRRAEHIIDMGPGAGADGGYVVAEGPLERILACPQSVTGRFLSGAIPYRPPQAREGGTEAGRIRIVGATLHNLRELTVDIPLGRLVCVSGVSGSGKSTLVREILYGNLHSLLGHGGRRGRAPALRGCTALEGWESVSRLLEVDQSPIGKTPRSCPATYVGLWNPVRNLFAQTEEARIRGYPAARFSFNVPGGRCDACGGQGVRKIEMSFLPDVRVTCETCGGTRFNPETLAVTYRDRSIGDVLGMSVDEAVVFFAAHEAVHRPLKLMQDVGLGYLPLGQQSPTLSGGEAQRIKLVAELARIRPAFATRGRPAGPALYVLDEPTIGLHMADVSRLIGVLQRLVSAGNTVVIIEHNLDVVAAADWIIDLGPEGGDQGGRIVVAGTPVQVARKGRISHTARHLRRHLGSRSGTA